MNDDYLWDKKGSDAEIEILERELAQFRLRPQLQAPLISSAKQLSLFEKLGLLLRMRPRLMGATRLLLILGLVSAALLASFSPETGVQVAENKTIQPVVLNQLKPAALSAAEIDQPKIEKVKQSTQLISRKETPSVNVVKRKSVARRKPPVLTADEQYAYEQLMLAISITGSKLREVKEMANGAPSKGSSDSIR
jgi:hypothetical protein